MAFVRLLYLVFRYALAPDFVRMVLDGGFVAGHFELEEFGFIYELELELFFKSEIVI